MKRARRDNAADGGALLACLHRHLARDLLDEQVELRRAGAGIGTKDRGVEAVSLHGEADAEFSTIAGCERSLRPVQAEPVKVTTSWPVTWSSRSPTEPAMSWMAPSGRMPDLDDAADYEFGQIGRLARGLHDGGHAGDEGGRDLFQHAPDREVEGVDVDRDAFKRREDVLGGEGVVLRQHARRRRRSEHGYSAARAVPWTA